MSMSVATLNERAKGWDDIRSMSGIGGQAVSFKEAG